MSVLAALWVSETISLVVSTSLTAVTVTVCAVSQFIDVNVRVVGAGSTSVPECPATVTTTFAVGWLSSTTV